MSQEKSKILLVDDFELVRMMVKSVLHDMGYTRLEEAENGQDAIDKIMAAQGAGEPFEIVFCDWNMPGVDGLGVLAFCRGSEDFKGLPIIMLTAESESAQVVKAIRAGATDYLVKPIAPDILDRKLSKIIARITGSAA